MVSAVLRRPSPRGSRGLGVQLLGLGKPYPGARMGYDGEESTMMIRMMILEMMRMMKHIIGRPGALAPL